MRPTMSGRPLLSCVACHSSVMVPELPGMVTRSACAVSATSSLLAATAALVPGGDGDTIGGSGRANGLLEVHVVVRADRAGNEAHALRRHLALRVERLHEEPRNAVARLAALGDDPP